MKDKNDQRARLLADTFHRDWEAGPPAAFALAAAAMARRRELVRRSIRAAGTAGLIAIAVFFLLRRQVAPSPPLAEAALPVAMNRGYEILSDDELVAQVHDQPLLILRRADGARQILVLAGGSE